jgi:hypothetical protein
VTGHSEIDVGFLGRSERGNRHGRVTVPLPVGMASGTWVELEGKLQQVPQKASTGSQTGLIRVRIIWSRSVGQARLSWLWTTDGDVAAGNPVLVSNHLLIFLTQGLQQP